MGLDTDAALFYGICENEEDHDSLSTSDWWGERDLDAPPEGIELDHAGSFACPIPYIYSEPTRQMASGDTNTVAKLEPFPPTPPPENHIAWLYKAADQLGWPYPDWHLAVMLNQG